MAGVFGETKEISGTRDRGKLIMTKKEKAMLLSGGNFEKAEQYLTEGIEWNLYEDKQTVRGKINVLKFCKKVSEYFESITTKFEMFGIIEEKNRVSIYGRAEFIRESKTVNIVHSCDVYEFDEEDNVKVIHSYCNSNRPE